jgi:selenocysteine lyase/cysteine desulfurase
MHALHQHVGDARRFPVLAHWDYLNHAGVSPLPACVAAALRQYANEFESHGYLGAVSFKEVARIKQILGQLINATPAEIAVMKNVGEAISTVALGLDWKPGDRVVAAAVEYPANIYPWMEAARRHGIELHLVPERSNPDGTRSVPVEQIIEAASHARCRVVALSHVQFASGQRLPLEALGAWCRDNGRLLCVDAIQSVGALPVDVMSMNIDVLCGGGQKWMLGPMGAGMLYIRAELLEQIRPLAIGAYSVRDPDNYGHLDYTFESDMRRHECGTPPFPAVVGWRASAQMLCDVGIDAIAQRIRGLTDRLIRVLPAGWRTVSPRDDVQWSGIVAIVHEDPSVDLQSVARQLRVRHKIELIVREGRLRASPHFYNTDEQIDRVAAALGEVISEIGRSKACAV